MAEQGTGKWKVGKSEGRSGGEAESERGKAERSGNVGKRSSYEGVPLTVESTTCHVIMFVQQIT